MSYQADWFDRNIPYWTKYLSRFKGKPNLKFLELGCFEGRTTTWLFKNILTDPTSTLIALDTFKGSPEFSLFGIDVDKIESNFKENIAPYEDRVTIKKDSSDQIRYWTEKRFEFIYIDASHRAFDVLRDGVLSFDLLAPGGSIIFDDYNWDAGGGEKERPHEAIQACIKIWGGYYGSWQFWLDQAAFTKYQ